MTQIFNFFEHWFRPFLSTVHTAVVSGSCVGVSYLKLQMLTISTYWFYSNSSFSQSTLVFVIHTL